MRSFEHLVDLQPLVGQEVGVSDWIGVDQRRIDQFAEATGDHQWIHVDPARAAAGPFGATVAHGFLTLSLLPEMSASAFKVLDTRMGVNYGLNRVRFPAPVPVGKRIRVRTKLLALQEAAPGAAPWVQVTWLHTVEGEDAGRPAMVAEAVTRFVF